MLASTSRTFGRSSCSCDALPSSEFSAPHLRVELYLPPPVNRPPTFVSAPCFCQLITDTDGTRTDGFSPELY